MRMRRIAEEHARTLAPADRAVLAAYARGVNYFIETHRNALPLEFTLLRYDPRPWTIVDSLLCGPADVSHPDQHVARRAAQDDDARGRRSGQGGAALSGPRGHGIPAGIQCVGGFRETHGERQADSGE